MARPRVATAVGARRARRAAQLGSAIPTVIAFALIPNVDRRTVVLAAPVVLTDRSVSRTTALSVSPIPTATLDRNV